MVTRNGVVEHPQAMREIAGVICRNMMASNPAEKIKYRPYTKEDFVQRTLASSVNINLDGLFEDAALGDYAYVEVDMLSERNTMALLTVKGAEEVLVNGTKTEYADDEFHIHTPLNKGDNRLIFKCRKDKENFGVEYMVSYPCYPWLWTCDYILWTRDASPVWEYRGEQGFSVSELICAEAEKLPSGCKLAYPLESESDAAVDFNLLYKGEKGKYAFSYTCVLRDGLFELCAEEQFVTVYVNGKKKSGLEFNVNAGDEILIASERNGGSWGYECKSCNMLGLPFIESMRKEGTHYIHIGAFESNLPPGISFVQPYKNADGRDTYWRFTDEKTYLRPYLDTSFYGQWFYGNMVAFNGFLQARKFGEGFYQYFEEGMKILARYYRYMQYDAAAFGDSTFLKRSILTQDLDSIGTIGMNLCELYTRVCDEELKKEIRYVLERLAESVYTKIPRLDDGTFCRNDVMWADDTYMSCPFLVRMGNLTGDTKYYDEVVLQLKNYFSRHFMEDKGVFAHIYWVFEERNNKVPWGRGNAWVYLSFAEVIEHLPENYPGKDTLVQMFIKAVEGLTVYQAECGRWCQVLTMDTSYKETSCTAIFSMAMQKGIKLGILEKSKYLPIVKRAVEGIIKHSVDESGNVLGVCRGSGCCDDPAYYANLGTVLNDAHGTGVVVSAICGLVELLEG